MYTFDVMFLAKIAKHLSSLGGNVVMVDRNSDLLNCVAEEIIAAGQPVPFAIIADVTKDAEHIVYETVRKFGKLDVLINNVGMISLPPFSISFFTSFYYSISVHSFAIYLIPSFWFFIFWPFSF